MTGRTCFRSRVTSCLGYGDGFMTAFGVLPCKFWCQNESKGLRLAQAAEPNVLVQFQKTDSSLLPDQTENSLIWVDFC